MVSDPDYPLHPHTLEPSLLTTLLLLLLQVAAVSLWAMMSDPHHPLQPYFASLPKRQELLCPLIQLPEKYLPLLQSDYVVSERRNFVG
jgi:hypothetical protein